MRNFTIIFSAAAIEDAEEAVLYYENIQAKLGKRFASQLQLVLNSIKRDFFLLQLDMTTFVVPQSKNFPF